MKAPRVKFHINEDLTIQRCRKSMSRCEAKDHYAEVEHAQTVIDNNRILAEREARRREFDAMRSSSHRENFPAVFRYSDDIGRSKDLLNFRERVESYREHFGAYPKYILGTLDYSFKLTWDITYKVRITVTPIMDNMEYATFSPEWRVVLIKEHYLRKPEILRNEVLAVEDGNQLQSSMKTLEEIFLWVLQMTTPTSRKIDDAYRPEDYTGKLNSLLWKFNDVFNAIEGIYRTNFELWHTTLHGGYFGGSFDDTIVINVDYNTAFEPRFLKEFIDANLYLNRSKIDVEVRLSDGKSGMYAWWVLTRENGVWMVSLVADGQQSDNIVTSSEELRGHVYWHVINEVNSGDQQVAFAKSQYAADLFDMVESVLPQPAG